MKTAEEILIKAWVNLEDLPKTRAAMVKAMDEYSSLVSEEKDRRIRELEEALESVLPFANEVLTKQGKDPDTREIFGYNNQALNIGQMRKIVQALNPPKP